MGGSGSPASDKIWDVEKEVIMMRKEAQEYFGECKKQSTEAG